MKHSAIWGKKNGSSVHEMKCCDWGIIGDSIDIHIRPSLGSLCDVEFKISKGDYRMSKYAYACVIRLLIVW